VLIEFALAVVKVVDRFGNETIEEFQTNGENALATHNIL
jgi:hypothetical protein